MAYSFGRDSVVIGLASAFLLGSAVGCGNVPPTGKPPSPAPSAKPKDESKDSKPPSPDPG